MENSEQMLVRIENELAQVVIRCDAVALERILADGYVFTNPVGEVKNKVETLAKFRALVDEVQFDYITNFDMRVQLYGDAAIVTGAQTQKGRYKGQEISGQYRFTSVYVRREGLWRCVAQHASSAAPIREI